MASDEQVAWFRKLVAGFRSNGKLVEEGPDKFRAQFGWKEGAPLFEISVDFANDRASFSSRDVPYGAMAWVFRAGTEERFSPFDDNTTARSTTLDLRTWLTRHCDAHKGGLLRIKRR